MAIKSIYTKYFQKSKMFMYPLLGFKKGATNTYTNYEPYKAYKKYKPYKAYKKYAPYKPYDKSKFSNESLSLFLMKGKK